MVNQYVSDNVAAGNTVVVSGYSQSTAIATNLMTDLLAQGVPDDAVKFVLTGTVTNPDGGLFERLGMTIPAFGATFSGYVPPDTPYQTSIYSLEYDGFADFPKYPLNFLAVLNAAMGELFVHPTYYKLTAEQVDNAVQVGTTADYDGATTYYMIPTDELPLLFLLRQLPIIGQPLANLLNPVLEQLVNLGYDNPNNDGWDEGSANVPTGFGLFPSWDQVMVAFNNLGPAAEQGFNAFVQDISDLVSNPSSLLADLADSWSTKPTDLFSSPMDFVNTLTGAFAQLYSLLLPAADTLTTLAITLPANLISILWDNLDDPLTGLGLAAGTAVAAVTQVGAIELGATVETLASILNDFGVGIPFLDEVWG